MIINKIGSQHVQSGTNCQDYFAVKRNSKVICDGCSEGLHSEVGAKLFCHFFGKWTYENIMRKLISCIGGFDLHAMKDYLCFTIVSMKEFENEFLVESCGDGFIITEDYDGNIDFVSLDNGQPPQYLIYNFIPSKYLKHYKDGVKINSFVYPKTKYKRIGIASDGLRFIMDAPEHIKQEFISILSNDKALRLKLFINKHPEIFKDDITILFE